MIKKHIAIHAESYEIVAAKKTQRYFDLSFDKLVIGGDLDALRFSFNNKIPVIYKNANKPTSLQKDELLEWYELSSLLSISRYMPLSGLVQNLRLEDDNLIKAVTPDNFLCRIKFQELYVTQPDDIDGLGYSVKTNSKTLNTVADYFRVKTMGGYSGQEFIGTGLDFPSRIEFVKSKSAKEFLGTLKDVISHSVISNKDLQTTEYSEKYCEIITKRILAENGIKGRKNHRTKEFYKPIKMVHEKRIIQPVIDREEKQLAPNIHLIKDIVVDETKKDSYLKFLKRKMTCLKTIKHHT